MIEGTGYPLDTNRIKVGIHNNQVIDSANIKKIKIGFFVSVSRFSDSGEVGIQKIFLKGF